MENVFFLMSLLPNIDGIGNDPGLIAGWLWQLRQVDLYAITSLRFSHKLQFADGAIILNYHAILQQHYSSLNRKIYRQPDFIFEFDLVAHHSLFVPVMGGVTKPSRVAEEIETNEAMAGRNRGQQIPSLE